MTVESFVELFELCFGDNLPDDDPLLYWLGRYTAWCLQDLLSEPTFLTVLPKMLDHLIDFMVPALSPPWDCASGAVTRECSFHDGCFKE